MLVNNISRASAESFPYQVDRRDWLLSIYSTGSQPATITAPFGRVVAMQFDDIVTLEHGYRRISADQAHEIARLIKSGMAEGVRCLWVHCDAGICRSGAVVEAAMLLGCTTDEEVSNERIANRFVFNAVRRALGLVHSGECEENP